MATKPTTKPMTAHAVNSMGRLGEFARAFVGWIGSLDPETVPLFNRLPVAQRQTVLVITLLGSLLLAAVLTVVNVIQVGNRGEYIEISTRLQMLSQRYAKTAQQSVLGNANAFKQMDEARLAFATGLKALIEGNDSLPASPGAFRDDLEKLQRLWDASRAGIEVLSNQREALISQAKALAEINQRNTELLDLMEQFIALLPADSRKQLAYANQQSLWTQRMAKNANALLSSDVIDPEIAYQLGQDARTFREVLDGLLNGSASLGVIAVSDANARAMLKDIDDVFSRFETNVNSILKNMAQLVKAKQATRDLFEESEQLLSLSQALTQRYQAMGSGVLLVFAILFVLLALFALVLLGVTNLREASSRAQAAGAENRRNQDAILRLLNEMGDLAEGDLTVNATVTEDITGAIADSINFAIEELRTLVQGINRAAEQVATASRQARSATDDMQRAAQQQAAQIAQTTEAVNAMTQSIAQVSRNAVESHGVAEQSLITARRGGDAVRESIDGMNSIRDQIQETSKRIKRLGESSQEIGEIVELISGITEQTNVLAINAAIQAAAAGDAGRGFSVVAEEVQRLAERSAQATRRIGLIVKTIQTDTQDAVNAMESSTQGVVQGASRSDAAGSALAEIQSVSERLARLIQNISDATQTQTHTAEQLLHNMQHIREVTEQALVRVQRGAESVGRLAELSEELRVSVSGFKL